MLYSIYIQLSSGQEQYVNAISKEQLDRFISAYLYMQSEINLGGTKYNLSNPSSVKIFELNNSLGGPEDATRFLEGQRDIFHNRKWDLAIFREFGKDITTVTLQDKNWGDKAPIISLPESLKPKIPKGFENLHPEVQKIATKLFKDGHYRQAILDTYIALVNTVKVKSGKHDLDNTPLMQAVFSARSPILKVSDDSDEQMGFMWLFSGAVMGIRNPKAHRLIEQNDPQRALEWLSFASVLFRVLDDATKTI